VERRPKEQRVHTAEEIVPVVECIYCPAADCLHDNHRMEKPEIIAMECEVR